MVSILCWLLHRNHISLGNYLKFFTLSLSDLFPNSNLSTIANGFLALMLSNWYNTFFDSMKHLLVSKILIYFGYRLERNRRYPQSVAHLSAQYKAAVA